MKFFLQLSLFFPLIFGASYEAPEDELIQLYKETKGFYLQNPNNTSYYSPFSVLHKELSKLLKDCLQIDPINLFNILNQNVDRQMAHFFFGKILLIEYERDSVSSSIWKKHLDPRPKSSRSFFKKSKELMRIVCGRYDAETVKAILPIILSIQRRYLHHLKEYEDRVEAARWINEFEMILQTFDPGNIEILLNLYKKLGNMALEYNGNIPWTGKDRFFIKSSLTLFEIYCRQFYNNHWMDLNEFTAVPRKILYFIFVNRIAKESVFRLLRYPELLFLSDFYCYNNHFSDILDILEIESKIKAFNYSESFLKDNPQHANLLRECIGNNPPCYFSEKYLWLIKGFFYVLPILQIK
jgi:hypothetical protein